MRGGNALESLLLLVYMLSSEYRMENKEEIIRYLKQDEKFNANIINFMESYPLDYCKKVGDSVVVKGTSDDKWIYISSHSGAELEKITQEFSDSDTNFAVLEDWMVPVVRRGKTIAWMLSTMRVVLPDRVPITKPDIDISNLTLDDVNCIYDNSEYKECISHEYISERIKHGISSCVRINGELAGWSITQDDGAIGFLTVVKKFRRKGLASKIVSDMVIKLRQHGKIPFGQIEKRNAASMNMAFKLGFVEDKNVNWLKLK